MCYLLGVSPAFAAGPLTDEMLGYAPLSIKEQLIHRNVQRFRSGLVCKDHRLLYHSTLGLRVMRGRWPTRCWDTPPLPASASARQSKKQDHTVGICLGPYGGPRGGGCFLCARYP